ncbi:hypothetical protein GCM10029964_081520 [Kibdelosporangium lantanae]
MIGLPDERDVELWRTSDSAIMRADLDLAVNRPTTSDEPPRPPSDAELIEAVRGGDNQAYGQLYERHVQAAHNLARQLSRSPVEVEDLVSEAFAKVLAAMRTGGGPDSAFRAYLLTVLRHTAYDRISRDRRVELADDVQAVSGVERVTGVPFHDTAVARLNRSLAVRAFASLPERWQTVLWHTEIEGQSPAEVAPLFGLTPNGVSAMAYRAREGLRKAYVQAHVERNPADRCRATADRLGSWTRGGLSRRETAQVEAHLDKCAECRALATELTDVNAALRGTVAPLVLGVGLAGYLAGAGKAGAVAAIAAPTSALSWVGPAASAAALVVAVTVGVSLPGSGNSRTPVANPPTSSVVDQQAPPPGQGGSSRQTVTGATSSSSAASGSATASSEPAAGGSNTVPPKSTTSSTANSAPALTPVAPGSFTTSTGGPPTRVPITIRNTGTAPAPPMTLTLTLPPDVKTVGAGNNLVDEPLLRLNGAAEQTVGCPEGKGTVTCSSNEPLAPARRSRSSSACLPDRSPRAER